MKIIIYTYRKITVQFLVALTMSITLKAEEPCCIDAYSNCTAGVVGWNSCVPALSGMPVSKYGTKGYYISVDGSGCGAKKILILLSIPCGPTFAVMDANCT